MNYGTLIDNTLHPAPRAFMLNGAMVTNPKAEHFAELNVERERNGLPPHLPIVDEPPTTDAAHYAVPTGWTRDGETWRRVYEVRAYPPPPPRIFSKLKIVSALTSAGVWPQVKQFIIDADFYDLYLAAQEFSEDNEYFVRGKQALQTAIGWTDAQVETILEASVV